MQEREKIQGNLHGEKEEIKGNLQKGKGED